MIPARRELFVRHPSNPILSSACWPTPVNAVFNPGAVILGDQTILLCRVEALDGRSHLSVARSTNGVDGWEIDPYPLFVPTDGVEGEMWGFEDARIVWLEELGVFAVTCTAWGRAGPAVYLALTSDFVTLDRRGIIRLAEDKNAALLPRRIDGRWVLFHRPFDVAGDSRGIFLSRSDDLVVWASPERVMIPRDGAWWDSQRIGIGPPLLLTDHGWLLLYHGVKETVAGSIYRVGMALLDLDEPTRVLRRCDNWVLGPGADYERQGDVANVVFPCGLVHDSSTQELLLYYGAADTSIGLATARLDDLIDALLASPLLG